MAHVFIVDENTLSIHLKYKFAGTGAKDNKCLFLQNNNEKINGNKERLLVKMLADISRVKKGDSVIFYLQQTKNSEGKFFGSFKVASDAFIYNEKNEKHRYPNGLEKNLTFRVELIPDKVYPKGVSERKCLDSLGGIEHPSQMCWSLIYRKLKGNRGCTMITNYEYNQIMNKIIRENDGEYLDEFNFDYDKKENRIIATNETFKYTGEKKTINIRDRLIDKKRKYPNNAYESHLQAYILQNIFNINCLRSSDDPINWIGNEIPCGVGMQSMDIYFTQENDNEVNIMLFELKDKQPGRGIERQLAKYIDWLKDYIVPTYNKKVIIHPTIIAHKPTKETINEFLKIKKSTFSEKDRVKIEEIRYISFSLQNREILFEEESARI